MWRIHIEIPFGLRDLNHPIELSHMQASRFLRPPWCATPDSAGYGFLHEARRNNAGDLAFPVVNPLHGILGDPTADDLAPKLANYLKRQAWLAELCGFRAEELRAANRDTIIVPCLRNEDLLQMQLAHGYGSPVEVTPHDDGVTLRCGQHHSNAFDLASYADRFFVEDGVTEICSALRGEDQHRPNEVLVTNPAAFEVGKSLQNGHFTSCEPDIAILLGVYDRSLGSDSADSVRMIIREALGAGEIGRSVEGWHSLRLPRQSRVPLRKIGSQKPLAILALDYWPNELIVEDIIHALLTHGIDSEPLYTKNVYHFTQLVNKQAVDMILLLIPGSFGVSKTPWITVAKAALARTSGDIRGELRDAFRLSQLEESEPLKHLLLHHSPVVPLGRISSGFFSSQPTDCPAPVHGCLHRVERLFSWDQFGL